MFKIDKDGEIFINGQKLNDIDKQTTTKITKKSIVIKNGKVIHNDYSEGNEDFNMEEFHNDFIEQLGPTFKHLKKIKCDYCSSVYKSSNCECPNCGATNKTI